MRVLKLGLALPLLAACQQQPAHQETAQGLNLEKVLESRSVSYSCGRGQTLNVVYDEGGLAHLKLDGQDLRLASRQAERGELYSDGAISWSLVNNGNQENGTLTNSDGTVTQCSRAASAAAPEPTLTACRADQLEVTAGEVDAAMGHRQMPVSLKINGTRGCLLSEWPEIVLPINAGDKPIKIERTTDSYFAKVEGSGRLALQAGQTARFNLGWGVIPHEGEGETVCPSVASWRVQAPGGGQTAEIPAQIQACGGRLIVSPFALVAAG